jgi:hypothetical protein
MPADMSEDPRVLKSVKANPHKPSTTGQPLMWWCDECNAPWTFECGIEVPGQENALQALYRRLVCDCTTGCSVCLS